MGLTGGNLMRAVTHGDDFQTCLLYTSDLPVHIVLEQVQLPFGLFVSFRLVAQSGFPLVGNAPVSYTHLDVYKRQGYAQQSSLALLYRLWNRADRDLCGVDLNIALGACLIADVFKMCIRDSCCSLSTFTGMTGTRSPAHSTEPWSFFQRLANASYLSLIHI